MFHALFPYYSTESAYQIVFIYSSVERYLDCFHFLTVMNSVVMNVVVQMSSQTNFISLGVISTPNSKMDHEAVLFWVSIFPMALLISFPPTVCKLSLYILPSICYLFFLITGKLIKMSEILHCGFDLHF